MIEFHCGDVTENFLVFAASGYSEFFVNDVFGYF